MRKQLIILLFFSTLFFLYAFIKKPRSTGKPVVMPVPSGWPAPAYNFADNPLTEEGIFLGRKLFYDGRLSKNGQLACASCHQQFAAMANFDHNLSHGFDNQFTTRNTPSLTNLAWQKVFNWDGGLRHLDAQPLIPITAPNEMAEDIGNVLNKLRKDSIYPGLFKVAFGDTLINTQRMMRAFSQFLLTMISADSKYDKVKRGAAEFNLPEQLGYDIFKNKCASCHPEPFFTDFQFRNNGLTMDPTIKDSGRMRITGNRKDSLKFKVPSLRNVTVTAPYMHDGRIYSLYDALEHYNKNIINGPTTDTLLKNKIPLSNFEKGQLLAFMATLTDSLFLKNEKFSPPEKKLYLPASAVHHLR